MKSDIGNTKADMQEYAETAGRDEKGREMPETMTDREILKELLVTMRALADVLEAVGQSPMAAAMMPGLSRLGR